MNSANRLHFLKREKRGKGNVDSLNTQVFLGEKSYFLNGTKRIRDSFKGIVDTYGNKTTQTCIRVKEQSLN